MYDYNKKKKYKKDGLENFQDLASKQDEEFRQRVKKKAGSFM